MYSCISVFGVFCGRGAYLLLADAQLALLQVVPVQGRSDLADQVLLVSLQVHAEITHLRDVVVVLGLLVLLWGHKRRGGGC